MQIASKIVIFTLLVLAFASCATNKYNDRDKTNPAYYEGTGIALSDSSAISGIAKNSNQLPPTDNGGEGARKGLMESAISLAAYPNYYKPSTIRGTCLARVDESSFASVPVRHLHVALVDSADKVLGQSETNDSGQFAFYVIKDKTYFIRILDQRYSSPYNKRPLTMGSEVIFHLTKKSA